MTDPGEDICDAIVSYINALSPWPFDFQFQAKSPNDIREELERENADLKVLFWPKGEEEGGKVDRQGAAMVTATIGMIVNRRLTDGATRRQLNDLTWTIRTQLRGIAQAGFKWSTAETTVKADRIQIEESDLFASEINLYYVGMVCRG